MHPWGVEGAGVGDAPGVKLVAGLELAPKVGLVVIGLLTAPGAGPTPAAGLGPSAGLERVGLRLLPAPGVAATPGQRPHEVWQ